MSSHSVKTTSTLDDASSTYSASSSASTLKDLKATSKKWFSSKEKEVEAKPAAPKPTKKSDPTTNYTTLATYLSL
ncbi:hypothetical protein BO71DRAFT_400699, partial [Aspergillus ellipticus CBS 707.79]